MTEEAGPPLLTVTGEAEVSAAPDLAVVRLGVEAQAKTAAGAQGQVNTTGAAIARALREAGVEESEIQTSGLTLGPVYTRPGDRGGEPKVAGYRAQNVVRVRLTDMDRVGPVLDAALAAGANRVEGVEFSLADDGSVRREALTQAVSDAPSEGRRDRRGPRTDAGASAQRA
jgi:uncharacterized protein YggE